MTPTQLRAFAAVVRLGSVKSAAAELTVSEAAVSMLVAQLRKELGDLLFTRTASGLAFTPGGLRLASRASEMLGLADRTVREVSQASQGRRLLRIAASSLFAEFAAPGLIELFARRADDLDMELSVHDPRQFAALLLSRVVDVAIGPRTAAVADSLVQKPFLNFKVVAVVGPDHPLAKMRAGPAQLREQIWLLGPSAVTEAGAMPALIRRINPPEANVRIFQSHAAALEEATRNSGIALGVAYAVSADLAAGRLVQATGSHLQADGAWSTLVLPESSALPAASELTRFISTPRATQAMLRGPGVTLGRFRPSIHVTLWS